LSKAALVREHVQWALDQHLGQAKNG